MPLLMLCLGLSPFVFVLLYMVHRNLLQYRALACKFKVTMKVKDGGDRGVRGEQYLALLFSAKK